MEPSKKRLRGEILAMEPDKKRLCQESFQIPDDVLNQRILPRLSCKSLHGFKAVSKAHNEMISSDTHFLTLQSLSPSPTSTGFVYLNEKSGLSFFPDQRIGIPDPSLKFLGKSLKKVKLLCSTNGLLLFYLLGGVNSLRICNPATMKMEVVPKRQKYNVRKEMGLAFNPRLSPGRYIIVDPLIDSSTIDINYSFNVFRSDTSKWNLSKQTIYVPGSRNAPSKPFYAQGSLFWSCIDKLLWFDPEKDCAGTLPLPYNDDSESARLEVGAVNDDIFCMCVTSEGGLEVWMLKGMDRWERSYELSMKKLIHESTQNLYLGLPGDEVMTSASEILRAFVAPLAFDGKNLYLTVNLRQWHRVMDASIYEEDNFYDDDTFLEYLEGGYKEADYTFFDSQFDGDDDCETNLDQDLLCCDMVTGKVVNTGKNLILTDRNWKVFHYHNSLVALPPISK